MFDGQIILGGISSGTTVILKQQMGAGAPKNPQQTVVVPGKKTLPEGGLHLTGWEQPFVPLTV